MRLEPSQRPEHSLRVSAKLITSSTILHLSADELERTLTQEQMDNPALEVNEQRVCLFCGSRLYGQVCTACGTFAQPAHILSETTINYEIPIGTQASQQLYDFDNYGFVEIDRDDEFDPLASIPTGESLAEALLRQLEALVPPGDEPIAEQLVGNLNERGYLEISLNDIADHLQVPLERVSYVLNQLHTLEPSGIGARNLRECLLIQLHGLSELEAPHPLAASLIAEHLEQLGHSQFAEIARQLHVPEQDVRDAAFYIRSTLHPYPAHTYLEDPLYIQRGSNATTYMRPDVIIRKGPSHFEVELIEEKRYHLTIHTDSTYPDTANEELRRYMHHHADRAQFFIDCIQRRWRTLKRVVELVVNYQREFLEKGIRYMRPLTRAEVATRLSLDEGTVSRATANKYALLPSGRLMPISDFFDGSLGIKDLLRELISAEDPRHRFSDEELARLLQARGTPMARRTVTKYREEMGIGSSRERG